MSRLKKAYVWSKKRFILGWGSDQYMIVQQIQLG